jgi:hypothetical protein
MANAVNLDPIDPSDQETGHILYNDSHWKMGIFQGVVVRLQRVTMCEYSPME